MTNKIKIFNSDKEARGLEGALVDSFMIRDGNDPIENIFHYFSGNFTPIQRLKGAIQNQAKELDADYGIITEKYETIGNTSGHLQNIEDCDKFLTIKVNFYKLK